MRLIDADTLKIRDISPSYWQVVDGVTEYDIEDAPTVDAVPVEWIKEIMNLAETVGAKEYAEHLEVLLADWAEREEE